MSKKTNKTDLQITFIHQFKRSTRTEWPDKFRIAWYFNSDTLDYIYEHKDEKFRTNGFVLSDRLVEQLPTEFKKKYFLACELVQTAASHTNTDTVLNHRVNGHLSALRWLYNFPSRASLRISAVIPT